MFRPLTTHSATTDFQRLTILDLTLAFKLAKILYRACIWPWPLVYKYKDHMANTATAVQTHLGLQRWSPSNCHFSDKIQTWMGRKYQSASFSSLIWTKLSIFLKYSQVSCIICIYRTTWHVKTLHRIHRQQPPGSLTSTGFCQMVMAGNNGIHRKYEGAK